MNNRIYHTAIDIINLILGFLAIYAMMALALLLLKKDIPLFLFALLPLSGALLSFFLQWRVKHIWSYLLLHLLLIAAFFLVGPSLPEKILCALYIFGIAIHGLVKRLKEEEMSRKNTSPSLLLIFVLLFFLNLKLELPGFDSFLFTLTIIFILLYLINSYIINFNHYFQLQQETSNIPMSQIKATNHTIIFFFLGMSFICMLLFTKLPLKELVLGVGHALLGVLKWLFSLFPGSSANTSPGPEAVPEENVAQDISELLKAEEPSPFLVYLQNFLITFFTFAMIGALIALVSYGIYKFYQAFYRGKRSLFQDNAEFLSPFDKKEKSRKEESIQKRSFIRFWGQSNSEKIRKAFYKAVLSKGSKTPDGSATPLELSCHILGNTSLTSKETEERSASIAFYYEKARYHKEDCSKNDVEEFKKLLR